MWSRTWGEGWLLDLRVGAGLRLEERLEKSRAGGRFQPEPGPGAELP